MLDSDAVVRSLYDRGVFDDALGRRYGASVFTDGRVDRHALAVRVFADADELTFLERLVHPAVVREADRWRATERRRVPPPRALVQEVQLLYETGAERRFDLVVAVTAAPPIRAARLDARGGLSHARQREARLLSDDERRARADYVIANDGDLAALDAAVAAILDEAAPCAGS